MGETELVPHVKGVTEFEIFEEVLMSPRHTVLPWDSKTQPSYTLNYKVSGGGRVYGYSLQPDNLATVDSDGKVSVHNGPGKFTVTAGMSGSMHNNHTAQVLLLNPVELELPESLAEWITGTAIQVPVAIYGFDPDTKGRVPYTDCADVPLEVTLNIQVAVAGYRENVLASVGATSPPSLPSPPAPFGEEEDEDYDYDDEGEPLLREGDGLAEEVELTLATDGHIDLLYD